ncbi:MAG: type I restriction-modification system subunit M [Lachnospiraceae bacterium]|nr:type I restriction-modification system subunit M [Lachnospiraceae bacterium]
MNKQQLANKIWESANKMRSKIEANEYKDYILGFIFYKFLSDKEVEFLKKDGYEEEDLRTEVHENNEEVVVYCQDNLGYFIAYDNLFSTWLAKGNSFTVDNVRVALSAFSRLISDTQRKVFHKIFNTLETGLSKLGESASNQTRAIRDLIQLIKDIPTDDKQDYDVLGFIYEYLISNFAANAGKKAGEFYTPHEVSQLMSEIVANHLRDKEKIEIYDPTSGSGSLLITIGKSVAKYMEDKDNIMYYAQEWKENTYNLTRMNLVMRGIKPDNIFARCGDTLEEDWPLFDDADPAGTYHPLYLDAVVSNPPYSQHWDPFNKENDPRYSRYGMAPKGKADYAFLLHDLYHIKPDGIMTIVLPHGVLFRGDATGGPDGQGEGEGRIRRNLIENNNIETIIGLPANIFYGTGIPTIIMVLRQKREESDVLFVDASKGYTKAGKTNKLMASDIKRIVDAVTDRKTIDKYSRLVTKEEIRANSYNLNIPRYIDSSEPAETWDIYATMFGGIPDREIEGLKEYWSAFPQLRNLLFSNDGTPYSKLTAKDIKAVIDGSEDVRGFVEAYQSAFDDFADYMYEELIGKMQELTISQEEAVITGNIFERVKEIPLVDKYQAYQLLDNEWGTVSNDLEIIQTEGFAAAKQVDPNMVIKRKGDREEEIQDGWIGHIIPFEMVQKTLLRDKYDEIKTKEGRLEEISAGLTEIIDSILEEDRGDYLNDDNTAFVAKEFAARLREIYADIDSPELVCLQNYIALLDAKAGKSAKLQYIEEHKEVNWAEIDGAAPYPKSRIIAYMKVLQMAYTFPEDSFGAKMVKANELMEEEKSVKKEIKEKSAELHLLTKTTIENLTDEQVFDLLRQKWIEPLVVSLRAIPEMIVGELEKAVQALADKYAVTYLDLEEQMKKTEKELSSMIDELTGDEFDMKGLAEFKALMQGEKDGKNEAKDKV